MLMYKITFEGKRNKKRQEKQSKMLPSIFTFWARAILQQLFPKSKPSVANIFYDWITEFLNSLEKNFWAKNVTSVTNIGVFSKISDLSFHKEFSDQQTQFPVWINSFWFKTWILEKMRALNYWKKNTCCSDFEVFRKVVLRN